MRVAVLRDDPEYALTLWQPWASAIVDGSKRVENRPWSPPSGLLGRRFWVHAGMFVDEERYDFVRSRWPLCPTWADRAQLPLGAIIGTARVIGWVNERGDAQSVAEEPVNDLLAARRAWWMGPVGWLLSDVERLEPWVSCRGYQRLWRPRAELAASLSAVRRIAV